MVEPDVWHVYALRDPRDAAVRYVGCTRIGVQQRVHRHVSEALSHQRTKRVTPKDRWVLDLLAAGLRPDFEIVERAMSERRARARERYRLGEQIAAGADMLNKQLVEAIKDRLRRAAQPRPARLPRAPRRHDSSAAGRAVKEIRDRRAHDGAEGTRGLFAVQMCARSAARA